MRRPKERERDEGMGSRSSCPKTHICQLSSLSIMGMFCGVLWCSKITTVTSKIPDHRSLSHRSENVCNAVIVTKAGHRESMWARAAGTMALQGLLSTQVPQTASVQITCYLQLLLWNYLFSFPSVSLHAFSNTVIRFVPIFGLLYLNKLTIL